jgi:hypothetical protein
MDPIDAMKVFSATPDEGSFIRKMKAAYCGLDANHHGKRARALKRIRAGLVP